MPKAITSTVVDAPASEVWALVRAFDGMSEWHPSLPAATIADGRAPDAVGCVRTFATPTGAEVRERLVALDDAAMRCAYVLEHGTMPVRNYRGTIRVAPVTDGDRSFVEWSAEFDCDAAAEEQMVGVYGGIFTSGLDALRARFG
jgi:hypothetical protein